MSYCINPFCRQRQNPDNVNICLTCGTSLLINERIRLIEPLRSLTDNPYNYFEVFEVDDIGTKWHPVREQRVIKVLKWNTPKLVKLIESEYLALQLIRHPNTPTSTLDDYFTFVPKNSLLTLHCLIMNKFEGQNLENWINSNNPISESLAIEWLLQLVEIIDVVHHTELFHRDIKPANIVLQPNGQLALIDFGTARRITDTYLAKISASGGTSTTVGNYEITTVITPFYTPLEQINGKAVPQSDFYALGRTFVRLLTGIPLIRLPTDKKTGNIIWRKYAMQINKPFADLLDDLMAPSPGQRPQSTQVILQRLNKLSYQTKIHRLTRSKTFIISTMIASVTLGGLGFNKIILPAIANALVTPGEKLEAANNSQSAQNFFDTAIKINPSAKLTISKYYLEKASRLMLAGNLKIAKNNYEFAIKYNNQNIDAYNLLGITCQQLSDSQCVKDVYQNLFKFHPNDWTIHYNLGHYYDEQGDYELAEKEYKIAIKSSDEAILAINNLSRLNIKTGDYNTAISLAQSALQRTKDPATQAALYKNLGWASLEKQKISDAEKYLEKAISLDGQRVDTYCLLSKVQEALGKIDDARISVEVCLLAKYTDSDIFIWRQELLDRILKK